MAVLGKRKAQDPTVSQEDAEAIFRRHFEAQFAPIDDGTAPLCSEPPVEAKGDNSRTGRGIRRSKRDEDDEDDDDADDDEWGGFSEDDTDDGDDAGTVEVVDHSKPQDLEPLAMSKKELKAFMVRRLPFRHPPPPPLAINLIPRSPPAPRIQPQIPNP